MKANLSNKLMSNYLEQNYLYHTNKKNSEINANVNQRLDSVATGSIGSFLSIAAEAMIIFAIIILIFIANQQKVFLILSVFFFIGIIISKLLGKQIKKFGLSRQKEYANKFDSFTKLIDNIREIIFLGKKNLVFKDFYNSHYNLAKLDAKTATYQKMPPLLFEMMGIFGLLVTVFYMKYINYEAIQIVTICTFFGAICYKVIPSLHKIMFYYYQIKYTAPILDSLIKELNLASKIVYHEEKIDFNNSIKLENVSFGYDATNLLNNINLKIAKGSIVGILGKSGSGKTTLLDIISGLILLSDGFVKIDNVKINNSHLSRKLQNIISYASQRVTIFNDTLKKNICFGIHEENIDNHKYEKVIRLAELSSFVKNENRASDIGNFGKNISGGQLQRIGIARALYFDKEIMIFDESTSSLDRETEEKIIKNINNANLSKTIIIVSHRFENLKYCDTIYKISDGNVSLQSKTQQ
jgi:ABC-type bacteriocin/lantibiotic exporter with double-glycine peptidase domain